MEHLVWRVWHLKRRHYQKRRSGREDDVVDAVFGDGAEEDDLDSLEPHRTTMPVKEAHQGEPGTIRFFQIAGAQWKSDSKAPVVEVLDAPAGLLFLFSFPAAAMPPHPLLCVTFMLARRHRCDAKCLLVVSLTLSLYPLHSSSTF